METTETLINTPLYDEHCALGARMAPFGGFTMPIQYPTGIIHEHECTRSRATLFDTCHMGEFEAEGENVVSDLENILSCTIHDMEIGQCRYGFICNEEGFTIDDQIIYRLAEKKFFIVVNAGTQNNDFSWFSNHISPTTTLTNLSAITAKIDLQGPLSAKIIAQMVEKPIDELKYYRFHHNTYKGVSAILSRTGYTGEIGFEIYLPNDLAVVFWREAMALGAEPAGLGARDTLRLEMGYPLYGHELSNRRNPAEAGFDRSIDSTKTFIGSSVVLDKSAAHQKLCAITFEGRRSAREGNSILDKSGTKTIGVITSGSFSPSIGTAIAFAYIDNDYAKSGSPVLADLGRQTISGTIGTAPFYAGGTCRKKLSEYLY